MCIYGNTNTLGSADLFGLACFLGSAVDGSRDLVISWTVEAEISFFFFFFSSLSFFAFHRLALVEGQMITAYLE